LKGRTVNRELGTGGGATPGTLEEGGELTDSPSEVTVGSHVSSEEVGEGGEEGLVKTADEGGGRRTGKQQSETADLVGSGFIITEKIACSQYLEKTRKRGTGLGTAVKDPQAAQSWKRREHKSICESALSKSHAK